MAMTKILRRILCNVLSRKLCDREMHHQSLFILVVSRSRETKRRHDCIIYIVYMQLYVYTEMPPRQPFTLHQLLHSSSFRNRENSEPKRITFLVAVNSLRWKIGFFQKLLSETSNKEDYFARRIDHRYIFKIEIF